MASWSEDGAASKRILHYFQEVSCELFRIRKMGRARVVRHRKERPIRFISKKGGFPPHNVAFKSVPPPGQRRAKFKRLLEARGLSSHS
mmetsp:Transcript_32073/g.96595  ORF Transcript_32073/g.96595 Transcript_32073/m.96595 type:complete len:88 (+) Transcript_32073:110-373(+)